MEIECANTSEWYDVDVEAEVISIFMKKLYEDGSLHFEQLFHYILSLPHPEIKQFFYDCTRLQRFKFFREKSLYFFLTQDNVSVQEGFFKPVGAIFPKVCATVNFLLRSFGSLHYLKIKKYATFLFQDVAHYLFQIHDTNEAALIKSIPNVVLDTSRGYLSLAQSFEVKSKHLTSNDKILISIVCYLDIFGETHFRTLLDEIKKLSLEEFSPILDISITDQLNFLETQDNFFQILKDRYVGLHHDFKSSECHYQEPKAKKDEVNCGQSFTSNIETVNPGTEICKKATSLKQNKTFVASSYDTNSEIPRVHVSTNYQIVGKKHNNNEIQRIPENLDLSKYVNTGSLIYKRLWNVVAFLLNCFDPLHYLELKDCMSYVMINLKNFLSQLPASEVKVVFQSISCSTMDQNGFLRLSQSCQLDTTMVSKDKMLLLFIVYYLASCGPTHCDKLIKELKCRAPQVISKHLCSMKASDQMKYLKMYSRYFSTLGTGYVSLPSTFVFTKCVYQEPTSEILGPKTLVLHKSPTSLGKQTSSDVLFIPQSYHLFTANNDHLLTTVIDPNQQHNKTPKSKTNNQEEDSALAAKLYAAVRFLIDTFGSLHYLKVKKCILHVFRDLSIFMDHLSIEEQRHVFYSVPHTVIDSDCCMHLTEYFEFTNSPLTIKKAHLLFIVGFLAIHKRVHLNLLIENFHVLAPVELCTSVFDSNNPSSKSTIEYLQTHSKYFCLDSQNFLTLSDSFNVGPNPIKTLNAEADKLIKLGKSNKSKTLTNDHSIQCMEYQLKDIPHHEIKTTNDIEKVDEQENKNTNNPSVRISGTYIKPAQYKNSFVNAWAAQYTGKCTGAVFPPQCDNEESVMFPEFVNKISDEISSKSEQQSSSEIKNNCERKDLRLKKVVSKNQATSIFVKLQSGIMHLIKYFKHTVDLHIINVVLHSLQDTRYQFLFLSDTDQNELVKRILLHFTASEETSNFSSSEMALQISYEQKDLLLFTYILSYSEEMFFTEVFSMFLKCKGQTTRCMWTFPDACKYFKEWSTLYAISKDGYVKLLGFPTLRLESDSAVTVLQSVVSVTKNDTINAKESCVQEQQNLNYLSLKIQHSIFYLHQFFKLEGNIPLLKGIFHALTDREKILELSDIHLCQVVRKGFTKFMSYDSHTIVPAPSDAHISSNDYSELSGIEKSLLCLIYIFHQNGEMHYLKAFKLFQKCLPENQKLIWTDKEQYSYFKTKTKHFSVDKSGLVNLINVPFINLSVVFQNISNKEYCICVEIKSCDVFETNEITDTNGTASLQTINSTFNTTNETKSSLEKHINLVNETTVHDLSFVEQGPGEVQSNVKNPIPPKDFRIKEAKNVFVEDKISAKVLTEESFGISINHFFEKLDLQNHQESVDTSAIILPLKSIRNMNNANNSYKKLADGESKFHNNVLSKDFDCFNERVEKTRAAIHFLSGYFKLSANNNIVCVILHVLSDIKSYVDLLENPKQDEFLDQCLACSKFSQTTVNLSHNVCKLNVEEEDLLFISYLLSQVDKMHYRQLFDKFAKHNRNKPTCVTTYREQYDYIANWEKLFSLSIEGFVKLKPLPKIGHNSERKSVSNFPETFSKGKIDSNKLQFPESNDEITHSVKNLETSSVQNDSKSKAVFQSNIDISSVKNNDSIEHFCKRIEESVIFLGQHFELVSKEHVIQTMFHVLQDLQNCIVDETGFYKDALQKFPYFLNDLKKEYCKQLNNTKCFSHINQEEKDLLLITFILVKSGPLLYSDLYKQFITLSDDVDKLLTLKAQLNYFYLKKKYFILNNNCEVSLNVDPNTSLLNCFSKFKDFNSSPPVALEKESAECLSSGAVNASKTVQENIAYQITNICNEVFSFSGKMQDNVKMLQDTMDSQALSKAVNIYKKDFMNLKLNHQNQQQHDLMRNDNFLAMCNEYAVSQSNTDKLELNSKSFKKKDKISEFKSQEYAPNIPASTTVLSTSNFDTISKENNFYVNDLIDSILPVVTVQPSVAQNLEIAQSKTKPIYNLLELETEQKLTTILPCVANFNYVQKKVKRKCSTGTRCTKDKTMESRIVNFFIIVLGQYDKGATLVDLSDKLLLASDDVQHYVSCFYQNDLLIFFCSHEEFYVSLFNVVSLR